MSSSGDASINISTSDDGGTVLSEVTNFINDGGSIATLLTSSIAGLLVSPFIAATDVIFAVTSFFTTPLSEISSSISSLSGAFFQEPADLIADGFAQSSTALASFFGEGFLGIFSGPVAVALVLVSVYLVVQYLQEDETGDVPLLGLGLDAPTETLGVEEEDPGDDS